MENTIKMLIAEDSAEFADVGTAVYEEFGVSPSFARKTEQLFLRKFVNNLLMLSLWICL